MHLIQQKFQKDADEVGQLLLGAGQLPDGSELRRDIEVTGLNFSPSQHRAVTALNYLLDGTGFKGNLPAERGGRESRDWRFTGPIPRLEFTLPEYFEAYGIQRKAGTGFWHKEAEDALAALRSLAQAFRIMYKKLAHEEHGSNGERMWEVVVIEQGLISILTSYGRLKTLDAEVLKRVEDPGKVKKIAVKFAPIWVDGITSYYLLKPVTLYREIRALHGSRRFSPAVYGMADLLLTLDRQRLGMEVRTLMRRLWLDRELEREQPARARRYLEDAFRTALATGLLRSWEYDGFGRVILELNPERCSRVRRLLKAGEPGPGDPPLSLVASTA